MKNRRTKALLVGLAIFIAIGGQAQKIDNLVELKQKSSNELFHCLGKAPRTPAFDSEGYWVWGSSVVKGEDGKYHIYVSRFPKSLPFHPGWMVASEIVHAVSDTPQGPYRFSDIALPPRGAQYWDGRSTHNPRILKHGSRYYLIYMGSTHPFADPTHDELTLDSPWCIVARANKRIGLAVADEIVSLHGGTLGIESQEGVGTVVTIRLPSCAWAQAHPDLPLSPEIQKLIQERNQNAHE